MQNSFQKSRPITLIGMMGSGKSLVSRHLASHLQRQFFDSDSLIEEHEKKTITEIFSEKGEAFFRKLEAEIIQEIIAEENIVFAVGGGAFAQKNLQKILLEKTFCIWLDASVDTLFLRLADDNSRPLLAQKNSAEKKSAIAALLEKRVDSYKRAHLRVCVDDLSAEEIVLEIITKLSKNGS
jgi:shikimate kinase